MSILDDLLIRFPELDPEKSADSWARLENAWPCYYGGSYNGCGKEIILNLIAHLMTVDNSDSGASVRPSVSQSVGSVSESYEPRSKNNWRSDFFGSTKYGETFLFLTSQRFGALFV
jgi:hypothetical protein